MKKTITFKTNDEVIATWKGSIVPRIDEFIEVENKEYLVFKVKHKYDEVVVSVAEVS